MSKPIKENLSTEMKCVDILIFVEPVNTPPSAY
jgi:hypothetical protein